MARIGVVVATRNRARSLLATLDRLEALPERPPIVVVDNGSTDGTPDVVRASHPRVEVVALGQNRGSAARTVGAEHVGTPLVAFSDDDSWWAPGALTRAAEEFDRYPRLALLAARVLVGPDEREDPTCAAMAASPLRPASALPGPPVLGFVACGAVVRRDAFLEVGGFHPRFGIGGEERVLAVDLSRRGWQLAYVADVVAHHHPSGARDERRRREVEVRNELWFAWLRRPARSALAATGRQLAAGLRDHHGRAGAFEALRGLPWVVRDRRPIGRALEIELRVLGL